MNRRHPATRRGTTLLELLLSLSIFGLLSTAGLYLLVGSINVNTYTINESGAIWNGEFAWRRISANAQAAIPTASGGMTPLVTTDANGQSHLKFIIPDVANNTTRTLQYYCTGTSAPFTLVEDDSRYDIAGAPSPIAYNVQSFSASTDATTTMKIWGDLTISPTEGWKVRRHFCVNARDF